MPVSDEARELARKAKAELIRRGRHRGDYYESDTFAVLGPEGCKVCVLGAISAAITARHSYTDLTLLSRTPAAEEVVGELAERIGRKVFRHDWRGDPEFDWGLDIDTVANWHDRDTTTDDDVYRLLDDIAEAS